MIGMAKSARSPRAAAARVDEREDELEIHEDDMSDASEDPSPAAEGGGETPQRREKRKRDADGAATPNDEDEIARRRRRRKSLAFQQRRKSLTLSSKSKAGAAPTKQNRQYISDMYSTIIKMSSENVRLRTLHCACGVLGGIVLEVMQRLMGVACGLMGRQKINVKNSWSLHLIDHMEDILETPR
jgi:hypothetical protein